MKAATFMPLRPSAELRQPAEQTFEEGETLSGFVEQAIRESIERWQKCQEFIARRSGKYVSAESVIGRLEQVLASAKGDR